MIYALILLLPNGDVELVYKKVDNVNDLCIISTSAQR